MNLSCDRCMDGISEGRAQFVDGELVSYPAFCLECGSEIKRFKQTHFNREPTLTRKEKLMNSKRKNMILGK